MRAGFTGWRVVKRAMRLNVMLLQHSEGSCCVFGREKCYFKRLPNIQLSI